MFLKFLKLSFVIYNFFNYISCLEYSPFDIITSKNEELKFSCGKTFENSRIMWFKLSCDLNPSKLVYNKDQLYSINQTLYVSYSANNCSYYQCIILENDLIVYENKFRIIYLDNIKNKVLKSSEKISSVKLKKFSVNLKKSTEHDLWWFMWINEILYRVISDIHINVMDDTIEISSPLQHFNLGFIACLVHKVTKDIYKCGSSFFIRSSKLVDTEKILYTNLHDYITLSCNERIGLNIVWYKDGNVINFNDRILYNYSFIVITKYVASDSGYYQCISDEPFQMPYILSIFLVTFNNSDFNHSFVTSKKEKSTFILPCYNPVKNYVPEIMFWTFGIFKSLSYASAFQDPTINFDLYIYDANVNDNGLYQCHVYVSKKLIIYSYYLHIITEDSKKSDNLHILKKRSVDEITNLKLKAFANTINLSWSPPNALVKKYIIYWGEMYPGPYQQIIDGKENKFTIPSLRPKTTYFINILAETANGLSKSILQSIVTKEKNKEIFLTIPVNLKLLDVGDNWSRISWESRNNDETNEIITDNIYQVEYCPVRVQRGHKYFKNTTESSLKIMEVKPATTYEFAVRTCLINSTKCSDWSMVQEFTTLGTKPGDPPQHLTLSTIQLTNRLSDNPKGNHMFAVQVSWQPPKNPNGEIKNYLILVTAEKTLGISDWGERTVSGKTLNTVIDRLDLNRYYYFRIRCSNEYGKSPLSPIRIFKTPDENGKNVGPIYLSKEYYDPIKISEELKLSRSIERGTDDFSDISNDDKKPIKDKFGFSIHKWWIIIGIVVAALILISIILFLVAIKCRSENSSLESTSKASKNAQKCNSKYGMDTNEKVKFVNKGQLLTTPDLFRHTKEQNCHSNYLELEERNESPNSFSSNKAFPGLNHNQPFSSQNNYRNIPGHYTPPGLIHQQNMVMTTSQLTSNSNERHFYQVPFLHHVGHNSFNVFANSAPRVNAAASDFNSINVSSPISDFSDFTSSQATVLYDTSTAKSSGGKSSLSGSGSYNNGLGNKSSLSKEPILEAYCSDKNNGIKYDESINEDNFVSKAFSSEELCQEMANLEGLMKDLNNITQKEFEC